MRSIRTPIWGVICAASAALLLPIADKRAAAQYRPGVPVATLLVAGAYVSVNGTRAVNGMEIRSGDRVVTGPASSALLYFYAGGSIQLDANTDPDIFGAFAGYVGCWIRIFTGQSYSEGEGQRVCFSSGAEEILSHSAFNLRVSPSGELLTVTQGAVTVNGAQPTTVPAGAQASIAKGGRIVAQRPVSREEIRQITGWRRQYVFASGPTQPEPFTEPYPPYPPRGPSYWYPYQPWRGGGPPPSHYFPQPPNRGGGTERPPRYPNPGDRGGTTPPERIAPGRTSPGYGAPQPNPPGYNVPSPDAPGYNRPKLNTPGRNTGQGSEPASDSATPGPR